MNKTDTETFERTRPALMAIAYRMLGETAAAEDILQEAWLRWDRAERRNIKTPAAWLRQVTMRLSIDALRSARARREVYIGPWLPEPLLETADQGPEDALALAQECELALLWAMERLAPQERAAYIMRVAFEIDYRDIADTLGKSEAACRKLVSRARQRVQQSAPRFEASSQETSQLLMRFALAVNAQDRAAVIALLAPDACAYTDGGGRVRAALRPLKGAEEIASVLINVAAKSNTSPDTFKLAHANGMPCVTLLEGGEDDMLLTVRPNSDGKIAWVYLMRNPDKLPGPIIAAN